MQAFHLALNTSIDKPNAARRCGTPKWPYMVTMIPPRES